MIATHLACAQEEAMQFLISVDRIEMYKAAKRYRYNVRVLK